MAKKFSLEYQTFWSTEAGDTSTCAPRNRNVAIVSKACNSSYKDTFFKQLSEASVGSHKQRMLGSYSYYDVGSVLVGISYVSKSYYAVTFRKNDNTPLSRSDGYIKNLSACYIIHHNNVNESFDYIKKHLEQSNRLNEFIGPKFLVIISNDDEIYQKYCQSGELPKYDINNIEFDNTMMILQEKNGQLIEENSFKLLLDMRRFAATMLQYSRTMQNELEDSYNYNCVLF